MLEEDLEEERFFATVRRGYWAAPAGIAGPEDRRRADPDTRILMDYKQAGVDIDAGNEVVRRIRSLARGTFTPGVLSDIGSFGGLFQLGAAGDPRSRAGRERRRRRHEAARRASWPASTARSASISSITASTTSSSRARSRCSFSTTSRPAGWSRTSPCRSSRGLPAACRENGCALLGGETAEMPGFYADGEYDVAGFIVGAVARDKVDRRQARSRRRRADRAAVVRAAHERLLARAPDCVRRRGAVDRHARPGARRHRSAKRCWRRIDRTCR